MSSKIAPSPDGSDSPRVGRASRVWTWAALLLVLALCVMTVVVLRYRVVVEARRTAESMRSADARYFAAEAVLDPAARDMLKVASSTVSATSSLVITVPTEKLDAAARELQAARTALGTSASSSRAGRSYLLGLDEASATVGLVRSMSDEVSRRRTFLGALTAGVRLNRQGKLQLRAAVAANNRRAYGRGGFLASRAKRSFAAALASFRSAASVEPSANVPSLYAHVTMRMRLADIVVKMSRYGRAHDLRAYNRLVAPFNAMRRAARALPKPKVIGGVLYHRRMSRLASRLDRLSRAADDSIRTAHEIARVPMPTLR